MKNKAYLILFSAFCGCSGLNANYYDDISIGNYENNPSSSEKMKIEELLEDLVNYGVLEMNAPVKEEIFNNIYGVFTGDKGLQGFKSRLAFFRKQKTGRDLILLRDTFLYSAEFKHGFSDKKQKALFLHELVHDFWFNLLDSEKRQSFSLETKKFWDKIQNANSELEQMALLKEAGYANPTQKDFESFENLKYFYKIFGRKVCPDSEFFGQELYSIMVEKAFNGDLIIPKQLRPYYKGIITEEWLERDRPK